MRLDIDKAMAKLSDRERFIVKLKYWHNCSSCEIASIIETNENNVNQIINRAKHKLKEILKD